MSNPWYNPEHFGLEIIGYVDWSSGHYEFDYSAVWYRPEDGTWYYGKDSGCSCPEPFGDLRGISDLESLGAYPFQVLTAKFAEKNKGNYDGDRSVQIAELMERVAKRSHGLG